MTGNDGNSSKPVIIGPTWERGEDGKFIRPALTLGWAVMDWVRKKLQHGDGRPWTYTPEQARFICHWYALADDLTFLYRDGVLQRLKGWGKDPVGATICAVEFVGPSRPDSTGRTIKDPWGNEHPAGVAHPEAWVQTAAVSKEQTRNTMTLFPSLFTRAAVEEYSIDPGKEIIYAHRGAQRIEAVTSSPRTLEGARSTFVLCNETHHWLSNNEGHDMADVIERNQTKSPDGSARSLALTNAYEPSEDSVAQRTREAWGKASAGQSLTTGLLYDSLEAGPAASLTAEAAPGVIESIRGDSVWLNVDRIVQSILDTRNPPSRSRRFWYNQITATEDAWVSPQEWDGAALAGFVVAHQEVITLGFDGSFSDDHSALIGCHVDSDHLFEIDIWTPDELTNQVDRAAIDRKVRETFENFDVVGFYSDLHPWESYVDRWAEDFGADLIVKATTRQPIAWDMRSRIQAFTVACERLNASIVESSKKLEQARGSDPGPRLTHCGSSRFRIHALNAKRSPNRFGVSVRKEHRESSRKIDAVPAAVLARLARMDYLALPESRRVRKTRTGVIW